MLFVKWCQASKVRDFTQLWELVLLEEFIKCLPKRMVVYLNEQKVVLLAEASVLADEFSLTHKNVFLSSASHKSPVTAKNKRERSPNVSRRNAAAVSVNHKCF